VGGEGEGAEWLVSGEKGRGGGWYIKGEGRGDVFKRKGGGDPVGYDLPVGHLSYRGRGGGGNKQSEVEEGKGEF